jgi:hypothetical protein
MNIEYGALSNPQLNAIFNRFGEAAFKRCSVMMEFEAFLKAIHARGPGGRRCLEIGTYHGISAVILSQFFESVVCVSVDEDPSKLLKNHIIKYLGIRNIEFHDVRNNVEKYALIEKLDFDFAYQDGNHAEDTVLDFGLVEKCGRVLFHEYWPIQPPVWNLVNALPQNEVTRAQYDCLAYWERSGG